MAPSTYYATKSRPLSARARWDAEVAPLVRQLWEANYRVYGARKLWEAAQRAGHQIGRDQIVRLRRTAGIEGVPRTKTVATTR